MGMTQNKAQAALVAVGLKPGGVTQAYSSDIASGKVVSQLLSAGQQVLKGSKVNLVISKGIKPAAAPVASTQQTVPNVVGMEGTKATNFLQAQGFVVMEKVNPEQAVPSKYAETVQAETPSAGTIAAVGSPVTSKGRRESWSVSGQSEITH